MANSQNQSSKALMKPSANSTLSCLAWVDFKAKSINRTQGQHWIHSHRRAKQAEAAFQKAVLSSGLLSFRAAVDSSLTEATSMLGSSSFKTASPDSSTSMTKTEPSLGNITR